MEDRTPWLRRVVGRGQAIGNSSEIRQTLWATCSCLVVTSQRIGWASGWLWGQITGHFTVAPYQALLSYWGTRWILLELISSTLLFYPFILGSDLPLPERVLPSGFRNGISGKKNPRMLEFQERFQDAKKNSSAMNQWHHDGRSGEYIWFCLSQNLMVSQNPWGCLAYAMMAQTQEFRPREGSSAGSKERTWN